MRQLYTPARHISVGLVILCLLAVSVTTVFAQAIGDYRSAATGNWNVAATWQRWNGTTWAAIATPPTGSELITIQTADSVTVNVTVSITGTLRNVGRIGVTGTLTIANNGTYQHDRDGGAIPTATWATGSTLLITGTTAIAPTDRNQNFHHVTFNTPNLASNLNMGWNGITIGGNIRVMNTATARWYLTTASAGDSAFVTITGNVTVESGAFSVHGTSSANTKFVVHHHGNIVVTGGNFSISRGSQGGGTTTWNLYSGNFSMSNATTANSTTTLNGAKFVFARAGTQTITLGSGNTLTSLPIEINSGTTLDMGVSKLRGVGMFRLNAGATLATGNEGGLDSAVVVTGTVTLDTAASYIFNGTVGQITGLSMPATVNNLVIDNPTTTILSRSTKINGVLRLKRGVFDNTIRFTLGPNGSVSYEGGTIRFPVSVESLELGIPQSFFVDQNYPNPFNPSTTIRFGLPTASLVSAKVFNLMGQQVATAFEGHRDAGVYELHFDASNLSSGVYLFRIEAGRSVDVKRMILMK